ncbi:MAG TPA: VWA domain-containing protein [Pyrinomonadaceae bacterium]|jgi:VWFA-related protein
MNKRSLIAGVCMLILIAYETKAQKPTSVPATPAQEEDRVVVGTNEVLLDAIVRDKKGRVVKDLQPSDFEIYEDGVRQDIKSFRFAKEATPTTTAIPSSETSGKPSTSTNSGSRKPFLNIDRIGAVAIVFDRLSPEARSIARQAALAYLKDGLQPDDAIGVFRIDLSLSVVQNFTNNEARVRLAIDRALSHGNSNYTSATDQIATAAERRAALEDQITQSAAGAGPTSDPGASIGAAAAEAQLARMTQNILEGFERLEQNQQGFATTDGLLAIINEMARLPGRKALIFFSEGVVLPTNVMANYRSVISNANRANVSIYSVDAAGLRAASSDVSAGGSMTKLGQARARVASSNQDPFGSMMADLERNEEMIRSNPDSGLNELALDTGGLLIANTNDPGSRLRQVDEDLHSYYILSYTPKDQNYDGKFRQITIKLTRSGLDVQGRKGYYALNNSYGGPVLGYEAPALAVLSGRARDNSFASFTAAYSFPERTRPGLASIMVEVPAGGISFVTNEQKKTYSTNFSIVSLIKDESQRVVRKLSNQYLLGDSLNKLAATKGGNILFYKEVLLDPGRYTIASVVYDAVSGRSSVNTAVLVVPNPADTQLRLSSIVLIKNAERLPKEQQPNNPLHFDEVLLYPNLGEPIKKSAVKELAIFVTVYPGTASSSSPKLSLEIAREAKPLGQFSYDLPPPDSMGRIQYASAIPLDKLEPGNYVIKVTVQDGQRSASQSEDLTIAP